MNLDFDFDPSPRKLAILINDRTAAILQGTYLVPSDDSAALGRSLWESAEFLESMFAAAEGLGYIDSPTDRLLKETDRLLQGLNDEMTEPDPDLQTVYQLRDATTELIQIRKKTSLGIESKSNAALKIAKEMGLDTVIKYRDRVIKVNIILNQRIHLAGNEA